MPSLPKSRTVEVIDDVVWWCSNCNKTHPDDEATDAGPLYECGDCGDIFSRQSNDGNRCPSCNKFAGKLADVACPEDGTEELEMVSALRIEGAVYVEMDTLQEKLDG